MKSVALHNLGCKVNAYEMEVMQQKLQQKGYLVVPFDTKADIYIINTCTVTNIADRKSRQMLHRVKKLNPEAVVVAVGCYVQTDAATVEKDEAIDIAIGNNKKSQVVEILEDYLSSRTRAKDEEAKMRLQWRVRPLCHSHYPRRAAQGREEAVLESLFAHHGAV